MFVANELFPVDVGSGRMKLEDNRTPHLPTRKERAEVCPVCDRATITIRISSPQFEPVSVRIHRR
jgi:hypothetical protein